MGTFVIFDEEEGFAINFMEYVSEKKGLPFRTKAFSDKGTLKKYGQSNQIDLMLISDVALDEEILDMNVGQFVILSEDNEKAYYAEYPRVYKYQSAEDILGEVIECYVDSGLYRDTTALKKGCRSDIISVYSPVARSGKTSFAITLGQILLEEGPVLYINMEEFSGFSGFFSKDYRGDLSDLMYHYRQAPDSVGVKLKALISEFHGMDYVPPMTYSGDIRNVKTKYWVDMITDIAKLGIYRNIILDLSAMPQDVFEILDMSDTVYMPIKSDGISMNKLNEYEQFLLKTDREELINKTVKVKIPKCGSDQLSVNYLDQLLWGATGDFIRKLLEEEVAC